MKKYLVALLLVALTAPSGRAIEPKNVKPVKNIILMITDGTSISAVSMSRWLQYYRDPSKPKLNIDPYLCGTVRTNCSDAPIGDSAPTTSCYVTGHASRSGYIATYPPAMGKNDIDPMDPKKSNAPMATILEAAHQLQGKSTGLVFTCQFPHATPADCSAHYYDRGQYGILAKQMVHNGLDVVIGGGNSYLKTDDEAYLKGKGYSIYRNNLAGMRADHNRKMWALYNPSEMDYDIDRNPAEQPSLAEMTDAALQRLSKNPKGFFIMIEGSKVDWAAHNNDPAGIASEFLAFDKACRVALDFARKDGNTAVIILPDHGNSGLSIGRSSCPDYSHLTKDQLFYQFSQYKLTPEGLAQKLNSAPYDSLNALMLRYAGLLPNGKELSQIINCKGYKKSPVAVNDRVAIDGSSSDDLSTLLCRIMTQHTCFGFTTGGHTGEDVFLAAYHPKGCVPLGMNTNVELAHYLQALFGMYGKMDAFTQRIFARHQDVFPNATCTIQPAVDKQHFPTLVVTAANGKSLSIEANTNIVHLNGTKETTIELPSVSVYVDKNKSFYLPQSLAGYLK